MTEHDFHISTRMTTDWRGKLLPESAHIEVSLKTLETHLLVTIDAPYYSNAKPDVEAGSTPRLWEFEVVECFILGEDERYLEMEFGPHGHYLLLGLHGERNLVQQGMRCEYAAKIDDARGMWHGEALVPLELFPPSPARYNAHAIHDVEGERRYMARFANHEDAAPNFHRLVTFGTLP